MEKLTKLLKENPKYFLEPKSVKTAGSRDFARVIKFSPSTFGNTKHEGARVARVAAFVKKGFGSKEIKTKEKQTGKFVAGKSSFARSVSSKRVVKTAKKTMKKAAKKAAKKKR